jgi:hypothetical protein
MAEDPDYKRGLPQPLDYRGPGGERADEPTWGGFIRNASLLGVIGGVVTAFAGTAGPDDEEQILIGCGIAAFALTWAILGQILHLLERRD